ncbi:MAG: IclR family transcriptional regulator domain-containing protein, partial [Steroidobacteraceae bacterium]
MTEGFVAPLFTTSVGLAILSQLDDEEITALMVRYNIRSRRRNDRVEIEELLHEVAGIRERGYAVRYDAVFPDTAAIGVPF